MKNNYFLSLASWSIIIVASLIAGYLYWFYSNFDKVVTQVDIGPVKEVRVNPFYAAERFLSKVGKTTSSHRNYSLLDSQLETIDTLIIESTRVGLTESKRNLINDWLNNGGHIILLATELYNDDLGTSRDLFLDELGIRLYSSNDYSWDEDDELRFTSLTFEGTEVITKIELGYNYYLQDVSGEATYIGGNESSDLFAQYKVGEGMVSVLTDMDIWKNYYIDDHDHAMFLYQLIGGGQTIWFLYNTKQPSLWSSMISLIPMVIISFLIIIMAVLFSSGWRKGSPKSDDKLEQREIMQHIEAAGEFSYRSDDGKALLKSLTKSLDNKLRYSIHQYSRLDEANKKLKVSQMTSIPEKDLAIIWQDNELNHDSFVSKVLMVQEIKRRL